MAGKRKSVRLLHLTAVKDTARRPTHLLGVTTDAVPLGHFLAFDVVAVLGAFPVEVGPGSASAALAGCSLAPTYVRPTPPVPTSWPVGDAYLRQSEAALPSVT